MAEKFFAINNDPQYRQRVEEKVPQIDNNNLNKHVDIKKRQQNSDIGNIVQKAQIDQPVKRSPSNHAKSNIVFEYKDMQSNLSQKKHEGQKQLALKKYNKQYDAQYGDANYALKRNTEDHIMNNLQDTEAALKNVRQELKTKKNHH